MIVVDASLVVAALVSSSGVGASAREEMSAHASQLVAPALMDVEVCSALRRLERAGEIPRSTALGGVTTLAGMRIERFPHEPLLRRIWELRHSITPYDAPYVAVAERLDVPLVTGDDRLAKAPGVRCEIRMIGS